MVSFKAYTNELSIYFFNNFVFGFMVWTLFHYFLLLQKESKSNYELLNFKSQLQSFVMNSTPQMWIHQLNSLTFQLSLIHWNLTNSTVDSSIDFLDFPLNCGFINWLPGLSNFAPIHSKLKISTVDSSTDFLDFPTQYQIQKLFFKSKAPIPQDNNYNGLYGLQPEVLDVLVRLWGDDMEDLCINHQTFMVSY